MKSKWIIFGILLGLGLLFAGPQNAQADTWVVASIDQVGQSFGTGEATLTHVAATPTFTKKVFNFNSAVRKEMLAVAMTALSLGYNVTIAIATDGKTINVIKIRKE